MSKYNQNERIDRFYETTRYILSRHVRTCDVNVLLEVEYLNVGIILLLLLWILVRCSKNECAGWPARICLSFLQDDACDPSLVQYNRLYTRRVFPMPPGLSSDRCRPRGSLLDLAVESYESWSGGRSG